jgi:hypothetical protein
MLTPLGSDNILIGSKPVAIFIRTTAIAITMVFAMLYFQHKTGVIHLLYQSLLRMLFSEILENDC